MCCLPSNVRPVTIQRIATIVGCILCLNFGITFAITPAHVRLYQSAALTPLNRPIDDTTAIWISSSLFLSAAFGALFAGPLSQRIGPKSMLLLSGLLQICSWFSIHFGDDVVHILQSRISAGIAAGAAFAVLPIYITEISDESNFASLALTIEQTRALGILVGFVLSLYSSYEHVSIIGGCVSLAFTMIFPFMQESPLYFMRKKNVQSMEKALRWFRGIRSIDDRANPEFLVEVTNLKNKMLNQNQTISSTSGISLGYFLRLCATCLLLLAGGVGNGVFVILSYITELFQTMHIPVEPRYQILILAGVTVIGSTVAFWIVPRFNRKLVFCLTSGVCGLTLISISYFVTNSPTLNFFWSPFDISTLPLYVVALHMLVASLGILPSTALINKEIFPTHLYPLASSVVSSLTWLLTFLLILFYHDLANMIGSCFWVLAVVCLFSMVFTIFFLFETRGRSTEEVQELMGHRKRITVATIVIVENGHLKSKADLATGYI